jgi:general secretion pathway protein H
MRQDGFTLLELLVVLAILSFILAFAPPMVPKLSPTVELGNAARELAAGLRSARNYAVMKNRPGVFALDIGKGTYRVSGDARGHQLPGDISISFLTARAEQVTNTTAQVRFFPTGGASGGKITLSKGTRQYEVKIDWLTGRVAVEG